MKSPWTPTRQEETDSSRLLIKRAHEEFISGNLDDTHIGDIRGLVRDSWHRSLDRLVGLDDLPPVALTHDELEQQLRNHPLAHALDMIRGLLIPGDISESGVVIAVGDAAGRLLWVEGDHRVRSLTGDMGFVPGAAWSEDAVGTAAPGTAIELGRSVRISGAEHFNRLVHPWSCTAAPVRDPESREILGVIDITGADDIITTQAQLLVDATARAVEGELLVGRMRGRAAAPGTQRTRHENTTRTKMPQRQHPPVTHTLRVLGRDRALLDVERIGGHSSEGLSMRHGELLLLLASHNQGLSAEKLAELVYNDVDAAVTVRAEIVRLRKVLARVAPELVLSSRPYRLGATLRTDAQNVVSLLGRGAHRVALAAYAGAVLPGSVGTGVTDIRDGLHSALREAMLSEAGIDVLLAYADTEAASDDDEVLRACLRMLPARSPRRNMLVARIEALAASVR